MQLHCKKFGQGRAIVLLHGLLGSSDNWQPIALKLAETFQVFALDQRNHGQSPHSDEMDYALMADDLNESMEARGLKTATLIGHSMGGKTAMQFALQFPGKVERLVVVDMAPRAYLPWHHRILTALRALELKTFSMRQQIENALAPEIPDLALRRFLLKNLGRQANGEFFWKINLPGLAENYPKLCEPVSAAFFYTAPVLFLRGEKSDYVKPEDEPSMRTLFPESQIETVAGAGHWVQSDEPEEFLRRVLKFLQPVCIGTI